MSCNVSFDSNKDALVTDDLPANLPPKFNRSGPVDTDDIVESGELTLAAYKDRLAMLGVTGAVGDSGGDGCLAGSGMKEQLLLLNGWTKRSGIAVSFVYIGSCTSDRHHL